MYIGKSAAKYVTENIYIWGHAKLADKLHIVFEILENLQYPTTLWDRHTVICVRE
jgi:hypothetical protein